MVEVSLFNVTVGIILIGIASISYVAWRSAHGGHQWDPMSLVGVKGIAEDTFSEEGTVIVRGEIWRARVSNGLVEKGESIVVRAVNEGMVLDVERG